MWQTLGSRTAKEQNRTCSASFRQLQVYMMKTVTFFAHIYRKVAVLIAAAQNIYIDRRIFVSRISVRLLRPGESLGRKCRGCFHSPRSLRVGLGYVHRDVGPQGQTRGNISSRCFSRSEYIFFLLSHCGVDIYVDTCRGRYLEIHRLNLVMRSKTKPLPREFQ